MNLADELEAQARAAAREAELLLARARKVREEEHAKPEPTQQQPTLYTVAQFVERHAFLTEGMLRRHLFHRLTNGLISCGAVAKLGYRLLIDEPKFLDWLRANAQTEVKKARKSA